MLIVEKCYKCGADTDNKLGYTVGVISSDFSSEHTLHDVPTHENTKRFNGNHIEISICHECMVKLDKETDMCVLKENAKYEEVGKMKKEKTMIAEDAFEFDIELSLLKDKDFTENLDTANLKRDYKVEVDVNLDFETINELKKFFSEQTFKMVNDLYIEEDKEKLNSLYGKDLFKDECKPLEKTLELIDALGKNSKYEKALDKLQNQYDSLAKAYGDLLTELKGYKELEVKFNELGKTYDVLAKDYEDLAKENKGYKELKVKYNRLNELYMNNSNVDLIYSLKRNHKKLNDKYTDLKELDKRKNERIRNQSATLGDYQNKVIGLNEENERLKDELKTFKNRYIKYQVMVENLLMEKIRGE